MAAGSDESSAPGSAPSGVYALRSLHSRNYRLFFGGQSVSLVGTWITRIAISWLVYRLTHSALMLGVVGFAGQIPTLLLAPFAGVLVDRYDRHRILVATQVLSMLQSLALAVLALAGVITVTQVLWLSVLQGVINAFDTPARQSFLVEMVDRREDLPNAIALNSSMVNGSRLVGPSVGGALIAAFGEGWCFMVDAVSYIAVIVSLLAMHVRRAERPRGGAHPLKELRDGLRYVAGSSAIRNALILLAVVSTMGVPYSVLMPQIAASVLHGGPHTLGYLMTASGVGALGGAVYLAMRRSVVGLGRVIVGATVAFGVGLIAFALARSVWVALVLLVVVGAGFMIQMAATNTILQTIVEESMRGRVMAFYTMAFLGTAPLGSLLAGVLASRVGAPYTILAGGVTCVVAGAVFARVLPRIRESVHPIYVERGLLPVAPAPDPRVPAP